MMGRRLVFVLPSLMLSKTPVGRGFAYIIMSVGALVLHAHQLPFQDPFLNKVENASLSALNILCASNLLSMALRSHGIAMDTSLTAVHTLTSWLLLAVVAVAMCVLLLRWRRWRVFWTAKGWSVLGYWQSGFERNGPVELQAGAGSRRPRSRARRDASLEVSALADPLL